ncbi:hypothetical protein MMC29_005098 [Sticta canariensis]|nr:hypothetical protein [Sticta canariensis]
MDGVSAAASIIALVEISVKVLSLTVEYPTYFKDAQEDIARFRLELDAFIKVLRNLRKLTQNPDLENMQKKLEPSKGQKAMSWYGVGALKWPFERKELRDHIGTLERHKSTFSTALNADQTTDLQETSFSLSRGDYSHAGKLLSTVAIQLARTSPTLKRYICEAIAENENVGRQSMHEQWAKLICQPTSRLKGDLQPPLILVFVFDALDECGRQEDIRKLLRLLAQTKDLAAV